MCGNLLLDVRAHLDGALVQEGLAVVEEVDAPERGPGLVDDAREEIEVEHARLARSRDAGLRRAARLEAGDVAGRGALDIEAAGNRRHVERALRRRLVGLAAAASADNRRRSWSRRR